MHSFYDDYEDFDFAGSEAVRRILRDLLGWHYDMDRECAACLLAMPVHSQAKLYAVACQLQERPSKTLEYKTTAEQCNASHRPVKIEANAGSSTHS